MYRDEHLRGALVGRVGGGEELGYGAFLDEGADEEVGAEDRDRVQSVRADHVSLRAGLRYEADGLAGSSAGTVEKLDLAPADLPPRHKSCGNWRRRWCG